MSSPSSGPGKFGGGSVVLKGPASLDDRTRYGLVVMEVQALLGGRSQRLAISDFSRRGAFLESHEPAPIGAVLHLDAPLLGQERVQLRARVVRTVSATDASIARTLPGMGVLFFGLTASAQRLVDSVLGLFERLEAVELPGRLEALGMTFGAYRLVAPDNVPRNNRRRTALDLMASGRAAFEQGAFVRAALELTQATSLDPSDPSMRGWAERACQRAAEAKAKLAFLLGVYADQRGDAEGAQRYYAEAAILAPDNAEYHRRALRDPPTPSAEPALSLLPEPTFADLSSPAATEPDLPSASAPAAPRDAFDGGLWFEGAPVGLAALGPDGGVVRVNRVFAEALGYAPFELAGRRLTELAAAEDVAEVRRAMVALREGDATRYQWRAAYVRHGGKLVGLRMSGSPLFDASGARLGVVVALDAVESVIRTPEAADYRSLVEHTGEAIVVHSRGDLVYGNGAAARLLGATSTQDLTGRRFADLLHPEHRPLAETRERELAQRGLDGEPVQVTMLGLEGQGIDVELLGTAVRHGERPAVAEVIRDVSHHKHKVQRLSRWVEELSRSNEELQQVLTALEARLAEAVVAEREGGLGRVARLAEDLATYVRVQKSSLHVGTVDVGQLLDGVLRRLQPLLAATATRVVRGPLPAVRADSVQLAAILEHLLHNALTHGGTDAATVEVLGRRSGASWTLSVIDHGPGIRPRDADRIFRLFERAGPTPSGASGAGAGLGLAICRRAVERHGGRIWVEETPGGGATVRFTLSDA